MSARGFDPPGMGWISRPPRFSRLGTRRSQVRSSLAQARATTERCYACGRPARVLWARFDPARDQQFDSARVPVLYEYFEGRTLGRVERYSISLLRHADASVRLRRLRRLAPQYHQGNGALRRPPERLWPSELEISDAEPGGVLFSFQSEFSRLRYFRLDHPSDSGALVLARIKRSLALALETGPQSGDGRIERQAAMSRNTVTAPASMSSQAATIARIRKRFETLMMTGQLRLKSRSGWSARCL